MREDQTATKHRVTVAEAARILDTSVAAVRSEIKRGTLENTKEEGGTVYVLLPPKLVAAQTPPGPTSQQPDTGQKTDRIRLAELVVAQDQLVDELRDRVHFLEGLLEQANERDRENRRIIAALTTRIPELPPASATRARLPSAPEEACSGTTEGVDRVMDAPERGWHVPSGSVVARARRWWERLWR